MAEADPKLRGAGWVTGTRNHPGTSSELVAQITLDPSNVQYIFEFIAKTSNSSGANGSKRVKYLISVQRTTAPAWSVTADLTDSFGALAVTWSFAMSGNALQASATATSDDMSQGGFQGMGAEQSIT